MNQPWGLLPGPGAWGFALSAGPACIDAEGEQVYIVGARRLVWLSGNAFIPSGLGATLSRQVPLAAPYQPGTVRRRGLSVLHLEAPSWPAKAPASPRGSGQA